MASLSPGGEIHSLFDVKDPTNMPPVITVNEWPQRTGFTQIQNCKNIEVSETRALAGLISLSDGSNLERLSTGKDDGSTGNTTPQSPCRPRRASITKYSPPVTLSNTSSAPNTPRRVNSARGNELRSPVLAIDNGVRKLIVPIGQSDRTSTQKVREYIATDHVFDSLEEAKAFKKMLPTKMSVQANEGRSARDTNGRPVYKCASFCGGVNCQARILFRWEEVPNTDANDVGEASNTQINQEGSTPVGSRARAVSIDAISQNERKPRARAMSSVDALTDNDFDDGVEDDGENNEEDDHGEEVKPQQDQEGDVDTYAQKKTRRRKLRNRKSEAKGDSQATATIVSPTGEEASRLSSRTGVWKVRMFEHPFPGHGEEKEGGKGWYFCREVVDNKIFTHKAREILTILEQLYPEGTPFFRRLPTIEQLREYKKSKRRAGRSGSNVSLSPTSFIQKPELAFSRSPLPTPPKLVSSPSSSSSSSSSSSPLRNVGSHILAELGASATPTTNEQAPSKLAVNSKSSPPSIIGATANAAAPSTLAQPLTLLTSSETHTSPQQHGGTRASLSYTASDRHLSTSSPMTQSLMSARLSAGDQLGSPQQEAEKGPYAAAPDAVSRAQIVSGLSSAATTVTVPMAANNCKSAVESVPMNSVNMISGVKRGRAQSNRPCNGSMEGNTTTTPAVTKEEQSMTAAAAVAQELGQVEQKRPSHFDIRSEPSAPKQLLLRMAPSLDPTPRRLPSFAPPFSYTQAQTQGQTELAPRMGMNHSGQSDLMGTYLSRVPVKCTAPLPPDMTPALRVPLPLPVPISVPLSMPITISQTLQQDGWSFATASHMQHMHGVGMGMEGVSQPALMGKSLGGNEDSRTFGSQQQQQQQQQQPPPPPSLLHSPQHSRHPQYSQHHQVTMQQQQQPPPRCAFPSSFSEWVQAHGSTSASPTSFTHPLPAYPKISTLLARGDDAGMTKDKSSREQVKSYTPTSDGHNGRGSGSGGEIHRSFSTDNALLDSLINDHAVNDDNCNDVKL